jgi:hypothetical protein
MLEPGEKEMILVMRLLYLNTLNVQQRYCLTLLKGMLFFMVEIS